MRQTQRGSVENLTPEELAGRLDQQILSSGDSEGPALGRSPRAGQDIEALPVSSAQSAESEGKRPVEPVRHRLPARRQTIVHEIQHRGVVYVVEVGLRPESGQPAEVFITAKEGDKQAASDHALLQDAATLVSLAFQYGVPVQSMLAIIGKSDDGFASVMGAVLEAIWHIDAAVQGQG